MEPCQTGHYPVNRRQDGEALAAVQAGRYPVNRRQSGEAPPRNRRQLRGSSGHLVVTSPDIGHVAVEAPGQGTSHAG